MKNRKHRKLNLDWSDVEVRRQYHREWEKTRGGSTLEERNQWRKMITERNRKWFKEHPEEYEKYKAKERAFNKKWVEENPKEYEERKKKYREERRKWRRQCPEEYKEWLEKEKIRCRGLWGKQRAFCVDWAGGRCWKCDKRFDGSKFIFHHIRPKFKKFGVLEACGRLEDKILVLEMEKCLFLCVACHASLHMRAYNFLAETDAIEFYIDDWIKENSNERKNKILTATDGLK